METLAEGPEGLYKRPYDLEPLDLPQAPQGEMNRDRGYLEQ